MRGESTSARVRRGEVVRIRCAGRHSDAAAPDRRRTVLLPVLTPRTSEYLDVRVP